MRANEFLKETGLVPANIPGTNTEIKIVVPATTQMPSSNQQQAHTPASSDLGYNNV